ncbi:hypothetical protein [Nocardioides sp.]|uniref:hypothetical protein n=1 Tax=Nocardioides sp. TaxID=35761 RepID=UPI00286C9461|nr:hypothetical protein [Nocardioides sp.]
MLLAAFALVVLAAACGILTRAGAPRPTPYDEPSAGAPAEVWREAALAERSEVRDLQRAIAVALDTRSDLYAHTVLRSALDRSHGYRPVRVSL